MRRAAAVLRCMPPLLGAAFVVLALPVALLAQDGALTGRVVERGAGATAVSGAEVRLVERGLTAAADSAGGWRFGGLPAGRYTIEVRRIGFAPRTVVAAVPQPEPLTIALAPTAVELNQIVVTGSRREQRLADVAVTTEVVSREAIAATGAADLAAVLTEQTGIQFQGGMPSGAGIMLQGLSSERVLVLLDGQPMAGRIAGNFDLARIPSDIVERIEVVKGPQSALYGSEAMGGVVNVITRRPGAARLGGSARVTAGSEGRLDAGISANLGAGDIAALVDIGRRRVDLAPGRAAADGALAERLDVGVRAGWAPAGAWELDGSLLVLDERQRWPSGGLNDFADNLVVDGALGATWTLGEHRIRPALHASHFDHLARRSGESQPIAGTGDRQKQRLLEAELLYSGPLAGAVVDGGVEVKQERIESSDGRIEGGARSMASVEPFVQADWSTDRISIVPGARLSWNQRWGTTLTPRIALRYRLRDDLSFRAAAGRGFRAPDFKELYLQFQNDAASPPYAVYGNPDLRPEHSTNVTAGVEWTGVRLYARAQGFWNDLRDFIETRPVADGGPVAQYRYGNVSRGETWGAELEVGLVLAPVRLEAGYAYLGTRDRDTGEPLLGRPVHSARLAAGLTPLRRLHTTITGVYTGATPMERAEDGAVTSERDAFVRIDARVAHELPAGLEAVVGADNIFDARPDAWADAVSRRWYAGLSWTTPNLTGN